MNNSKGKYKSFNYLSCGNRRRGRREDEGKGEQREGEWKGFVAMGDHPSDSGTEMLFREKGNRSVSLLVNLWRISLSVSTRRLLRAKSVSVCVSVLHVKICILCECMSVSECVHLYVCTQLINRVRPIHYQYCHFIKYQCISGQ